MRQFETGTQRRYVQRTGASARTSSVDQQRPGLRNGGGSPVGDGFRPSQSVPRSRVITVTC